MNSSHPKPHHFITRRVWLLLILFFATAFFSLIYAVIVLPDVHDIKNKAKTPNSRITCTEEAKICEDGTSVGRTGPNCEFTPCPEISKSK